VIDAAAQSCSHSETAIQWNQSGARGPPVLLALLVQLGPVGWACGETGGNFRVVFDQNVSQCAYVASARDFTFTANVSAKPDGADAVLVTTEQSDGTKVRSDFSLIVACW